MKRVLLLLLLLLLGACVDRAEAQDSTAATLQRARELYERLELERALPLLRDIVSPGWAFDVTAGQRVEANLYLGATLVLLGSRDSAIAHFRAALDRDPFADLDAARFTPAQLDAFQTARRTLFRIGIRPVAAIRLDPRSGKLTFTVVTTHAAAGRFEIRAADPATSFPLFVGDINGLREIEWDGVLSNGQLAPSGRYAVVLLAQSRMRGGSDSTSAYFDVQQEFPALEDTVPDLQPGQLLPERYQRSSATADLLKGLGIAAGAFLLADVASNRDLGRSRGMAAVVGVTGVAAGVTSFVARRGRARPENIALNERRRSERASTNEQIRQRNAARRAQTILVIVPAAGTAH
jgi:tetratricopeptide (TPR) repeat protein